ncbi:hypothetical protein KFE25_005660 [Diacronema lutheri]|nr:hypothetical protein KFE25_005660 [Diacronema lutheri]
MPETLAFKQSKGASVALAGKDAPAQHTIPPMSAAQAEKVLAAFDLDSTFGPSVGLSRADRWERARALGLNPPEEVRVALNVPHAVNSSVFARAMGAAT